MRRASFSAMNCSVARSLEYVGEWWTLLIVRDALFGVTRFEEFQQRLGIARNILAKRLDTLVEAGVLERQPYDESRERYDYVLTDKGRALWPVLVAIRQWGDEWIAGPGHEPVAMLHTRCGSLTTAHLVCGECGERLEAKDIRNRPGPGSTNPDFLRPRSRIGSAPDARQKSSASPSGADPSESS